MKINHLLFVVLAMSLVSCNEKSAPNKAGSEIIVEASVVETRAGYEGQSVLPSSFVMDVDQDNDKYDYSVVMTKEEGSNKYVSDTKMLWADESHLAVIKAMTIPYGMESVDKLNSMTVRVSTAQDDEDNLLASDLLGASTVNGVTIDGDNVKIAFNHLMAKLLVSYKLGDGLAGNVTVNSATLQNVCTVGGYSYSNMDYAAEILEEYAAVTMYHDVDAKTVEAVFYPYTPSEIPNLLMNVTIGGTVYDLSCPVNPNGAFVGGKRYKLNVTIVGSSVSGVSVNVIGWDTDTQDQDFVTE